MGRRLLAAIWLNRSRLQNSKTYYTKKRPLVRTFDKDVALAVHIKSRLWLIASFTEPSVQSLTPDMVHSYHSYITESQLFSVRL